MAAHKTTAARTSTKAAAKPASKPAATRGDEIAAWSRAQSPKHRALCDALRKSIDAALPKASSKLWHGAPVWFLGENPVVGYSVKAGVVSLLFWNGVAFGDPALKPVGKYGAAEAVFRDADELEGKALRRWLKHAGTDVFDSQAFFRAKRAAR
jgi:hypothetical protein